MLVEAAAQTPSPAPALRVLLVVDSLDGGGAERHVADLAAALAGRGHGVTVACSAGGVLEGRLAESGAAVRVLCREPVKRRLSLAYARRLRRLLRQERFEVVHASLYASAAAAALALARARTPLVVTEHTEAPWRGRRHRAVSRLAYRRAARVIAVSSAIARQLRGELGVPEEKISFVLPVPAPAGDDAPAARASSLAPDGAPLIGRVGRLAPEKGVEVFLAAAGQILERRPDARFVVVGDGPLRQALVSRARSLGLGRAIRFLGYREDARSLMAALDVLVVSSHSDGSPLVVLEAMAAGVPVAATAVGGVPDQIEDGVDGLLVQPGDPAALAGATLALLEDRELARRIVRRGLRRSERMSHEAMVATVEWLYLSEQAPAPASAHHSL